MFVPELIVIVSLARALVAGLVAGSVCFLFPLLSLLVMKAAAAQ